MGNTSDNIEMLTSDDDDMIFHSSTPMNSTIRETSSEYYFSDVLEVESSAEEAKQVHLIDKESKDQHSY